MPVKEAVNHLRMPSISRISSSGGMPAKTYLVYDSPLRGKQVLAYASKFYFSLAESEVPLSWSFNYSYDEAAKNGQLNFNCTSEETIFSTQGYKFSWQVVKNNKLADGEIKGKFTVDENNVVSKEITFNPDDALYISASGSGIPYVNLKLQRK